MYKILAKSPTLKREKKFKESQTTKKETGEGKAGDGRKQRPGKGLGMDRAPNIFPKSAPIDSAVNLLPAYNSTIKSVYTAIEYGEGRTMNDAESRARLRSEWLLHTTNRKS